MERRFSTRLGAVVLLGFAVRAVVALAVAPEALNHRGDPRFFHLTANLLADGHGYIAPLPFINSGIIVPSAEHPPLWSAVLAVFSVAGVRSYAAHELVACAVGAATVACAGLIGRRVGGERVGLVAALLCAVYPVFVAMDGSLMSEAPYALCVALALLAALRAVEAPSMRRSALLGFAIGMTVLVRGEAIALLVLLLVPVVLQIPGGARLRHAGVACAIAVVIFAPWALRNSFTFHTPMLVSAEDGPVLAGANCARTYSGYDLGYWRSDCLVRKPDRNAAFRSKRLRAQGLDYAANHAGRLPAVEAVRLLRTFGLWQPRRHVYFAEGRMLPARTIAVLGVWLVLALGIGGAWLMRSRRGTLAILLAPAALAVITTLTAFGYPRFRYAADVPMLVLAASALTAAYYAASRPRTALSRA